MSTTPKNNPAAHLLSLADPANIAASIEQERRAKAPPGWLGITVLARADWQLCLALGGDVGDVRQIDVHPKSPAFRAGLRTGDFLRPISLNSAAGIPVEDFDALALPVGTRVRLEFRRHGRGLSSKWMPVEVILVAPPRPSATPKWRAQAATPCGPRVTKKDRAKFLVKMSTNPCLTAQMVRVLNVFALKFDNDANEGFWPSYGTIAKVIGCSQRYARTVIARLRWAGVLELIERGGPQAARKSNRYRLTWPGRSEVQPPRKTWRL